MIIKAIPPLAVKNVNILNLLSISKLEVIVLYMRITNVLDRIWFAFYQWQIFGSEGGTLMDSYCHTITSLKIVIQKVVSESAIGMILLMDGF